VFDVRFDPATGKATWTDLTFDPATSRWSTWRSDSATGDVYAATDFGVDRLVAGSTTWITAADDLPKTATDSRLRPGSSPASASCMRRRPDAGLGDRASGREGEGRQAVARSCFVRLRGAAARRPLASQ
jgi:hypothetical protein